MTAQYKREIAYRMHSNEMRSLEVVPKEDEEYATQYFRLKTGELVNRVFVCGTLTQLDDIGDDTPFYRIVVSDPDWHFDASAGQYSPQQVQDMAESLEVPCFVSIVGKIKGREHNDRMYFSIAVESINEVNEATYDRWCEETDQQTKERQDAFEGSNV